MSLRTYLTKERGRAARLAADLNVTAVTVHEWANHRVPADRCPAIERATNGAVRCEEMRPDVDWAVLRNSDCSDEQSTSPMQEAA
jgi:DNA-binding transcriptional regulator YdaS (Cro superfamily)